MKKASTLLSMTLAAMVLVSVLATIPASAAGTEVTVNSLPELQEAIAAAVDGDTIYIAGDIEIQEEVSIGTVDKTVFLAGAEGTSVVLSISPDFPDGQSVSFANLVFCGGQSSGLSFVQSGGISHFQAVRFQHPNENSGKSACLIECGSATFSTCRFEEGPAEEGGHIYAGTDAVVHADNCAFMTGAASECGGSIYALGSVNITDCSFSNGCAENAGGSVYAAGPLRLVDCTFYGGNSGIGGQIFCSGTAAEIIGCSFTQGYASQYGGGIGSMETSPLLIARSPVALPGSTAAEYGAQAPPRSSGVKSMATPQKLRVQTCTLRMVSLCWTPQRTIWRFMKANSPLQR